MTDTTDIAALMLKMRNLADRIIDAEGENNNGEVGKIIEMYDAADTTFKAENILLVLSAFEEQRQRADANAQEIRRLEFQWEHRAPTQCAYDQACTALHAQRERAEKAEAEIAALKGDQVPVPVAYLYSASFERGEVEGQLTDAPGCDMPVYDRPQKPVVLPEGFYPDGDIDCELVINLSDAISAIEAAGGIVKDGE